MYKIIVNFLNIAHTEVPRVLYNFSIKLINTAGHIIGHAIIIAIITKTYGIEYVPILLITLSIFSILGTIWFKNKITRYHKQNILSFLGVSGSIILFASGFFENISNGAFILLPIVVISFITVQFIVTLNLFIEEQFTPLEAKRAFPIIESSELIGGIIGGGIITLLANHIKLEGFMIIWGFLLFLSVVLVRIEKNIPGNFLREILITTNEEEEIKHNIRFNLREILNNKLLKFISLFTLFQFAILPILEFQYTKLMVDDHYTGEQILHGLGEYTLIVASIGSIIQVLFSYRISKAIGVSKSMLLNPVIIILPILALNFDITQFITYLTRGLNDITRSISNNNYLALFYVVPKKIRDHGKAFIEGIIWHLGSIIGMGTIVAIQIFLSLDIALRIVNLLLIFFTLSMILAGLLIKENYTKYAKKMLNSEYDLDRYIGVEALSDIGHKNGANILLSKFREEKDDIIKTKIIEALGHSQDTNALNLLTSTISKGNERQKLATLKAIRYFKKIQIKGDYMFTRLRIYDSCLQEFFNEKTNTSVKKSIIKTLIKLGCQDIDGFIINTITKHKADEQIIIEIIDSMNIFEDPGIIFYLRPFLDSENPRIKAHAIITLSKFTALKESLEISKQSLLEDKSKLAKIGIIEMASNIGGHEFKDIIEKEVQNKDKFIKAISIIAMIRMGDLEYIDLLIPTIINMDQKEIFYIQEHIQNIGQKEEYLFHKKLHHYILNKLYWSIEQKNSQDMYSTIKLCELFENNFDLIRLAKFCREKLNYYE